VFTFSRSVRYLLFKFRPLKGYCGDGGGAHGGLASAWDVVSELRAKRVQPNIRMVNTLLRGCLLNGDPDKALEVSNTSQHLFFFKNGFFLIALRIHFLSLNWSDLFLLNTAFAKSPRCFAA
jgi:hypothetical protein